MRDRRGKLKVKVFFIFIILIAVSFFVTFSKTFERNAPTINSESKIYWNTKDNINIDLADDTGIKKVLIEYSKNDEQERKILINQSVNAKELKTLLELPKPKFNENIEKYIVYVQVVDKSLWNWFSGNVNTKAIEVIVDNKKPQVSILSNSYSITRGGSAAVVFYAHDDNLDELYIDVNSKVFKATPFIKANYYISLIAWDIKDEGFEARIIAKDKANNIVKEHIPYYLTNKKYRVSTINVKDNFIDGKIKDLYETNSEVQIDDKGKIFDYVNATLRDENEKIIHKITKVVSNDVVNNFDLEPFIPLKNGMKVADFGDHRFYKYNDEQISESYHLGLDLASTKMAPITLSNAGKVVFAQDNGIYGLNIIIDHGLGLYTLYAHCTKKNVETDDLVSAKKVIASTGTSGLALGDHLHFGVLVQGIEVRPEEWMDKNWMNDNIFSIMSKAKDIIHKK